MRHFIYALLCATTLLGAEIKSAAFSPEKEIEMLEACGERPVVSFSQALRELLPGVADQYFDESYFQMVEKLEAEKFDGEYKDYWENGQLRTRVTFVKGIPDGHFHGWYPNSGEAYKGYLDMGQKKGIHMSFFYKDPVYKERSPDARIVYYDESGRLHGKQEAAYAKGRLKALVEFYQGQRDGNFSLYKPEGGAYVMKSFKDGVEIPLEANRKTLAK